MSDRRGDVSSDQVPWEQASVPWCPRRTRDHFSSVSIHRWREYPPRTRIEYTHCQKNRDRDIWRLSRYSRLNQDGLCVQYNSTSAGIIMDLYILSREELMKSALKRLTDESFFLCQILERMREILFRKIICNLLIISIIQLIYKNTTSQISQ